jgi:hypothetical protein
MQSFLERVYLKPLIRSTTSLCRAHALAQAFVRRRFTTLTGFESAFGTSRIRVILAESCGNQRVKRNSQNILNCRFAQIYAVPVSEFVTNPRVGANANGGNAS